jgi:hypothetical protein
MAKGELSVLRAMAQGDPDFKREPEMYEFYVVDKLSIWKKRRKAVGNSQCPVLPQAASGAPKTRFWVQGPRVKGNTAVPEGTVIASGWDEYGLYRSKPHGNHAAIYLSQTAKGMKVLDQWLGKEGWIEEHGFERTLPFGKGDVSNGGDHFYVVLSSKFTEIEYMMMKMQEAYAVVAAFG